MSELSSALQPVLSVKQITKRFPGIVANDQVDFALWPGEVHVLLGENGAGKSTLVSMLAGLLQPDEGTISLDGEQRAINSPQRALDLGIGTVFQHSMMVPSLTVVDNFALGARWWKRPPRAQLATEIQRISAEIGVNVNPYAEAGSLSLGEQQQAEIVRTLLRGSRVLILDEATAMLTPQNASELGQLMRRLVAQGLAVVFITHKLNEALDWGDRISVLRLGRKVGEITPDILRTLSREEATRQVVQLMFNLDPALTSEVAGVVRHSSCQEEAKPVLEIHALEVSDNLVPVSRVELRIRPGEIIGVAGIDGNGQKQLAEAIAGQRPLSGGRIWLDGASIESCSIGERRRRGLRYVTDNRHGEGTVSTFPVATNLLLKQIGDAPFWRHGIEQTAEIARWSAARIREYDIRVPQTDTPIGKLSGGNIQKAVLARELGDTPRAVIFSKPTYGLDLQNIRSTRRRIRESAQAGSAVMLISTDLEEILELADRIAVMSQGQIVGIVDNDPAARTRVGELMSGVH
ncbi:putative B6 ABC transporter ATP-binding protein [Pantoea sp. B65]|uniref:putative B6 ABC transporter ATP-binding protein n=1 Tax=Pantoea sp. B65 TaxID=2813359 RepID=UPI0039B59E2C